MKMLGDVSVIFQRFLASRLLVGGGEWNIADLKQFRRGEENHIRRIVVDGIYKTPFLNDERLKSQPLYFNRTGQAGGSSAHDQHISPGFGAGMRLLASQGVRNLFEVHGSLNFSGEHLKVYTRSPQNFHSSMHVLSHLRTYTHHNT